MPVLERSAGLLWFEDVINVYTPHVIFYCRGSGVHLTTDLKYT